MRFESAQILRVMPSQDDDGNWTNGPVVIANIEIDLQPLSGQRRDAQTGTQHISTHKAFSFSLPCLAQAGDILRHNGKDWRINFIADWLEHYELEVSNV